MENENVGSAPGRIDTYDVTRVANGFQVAGAPPGINPRSFASIHVFSTWAEASKWLGDQFRGSES